MSEANTLTEPRPPVPLPEVFSVRVMAGRTTSHPTESCSNLRHEVELHASIPESRRRDDLDAAVQALQARADKLVEDHKNAMVKALLELARLGELHQKLVNN